MLPEALIPVTITSWEEGSIWSGAVALPLVTPSALVAVTVSVMVCTLAPVLMGAA